MDKRQKQIALIAGAVVALFLVYRWYSGQGTAAASTGAAAPDTSSGDFASLAGQEQSDVAALQGQNSTLQAQEQSDVAGLTGSIAGLGSQEQADVSGLTASIAGFSDNFDQLVTNQQTLGTEISSLATGVQKINRAQTASIQTHKNGPFYNYYVKVTGHAPPKTVQTSNFIYGAWKSGVKAAALQTASKPHPSAKNNHVAHPNPAHKQQSHTKPAAPKPPPKPAAKPKPPPPKAKPKPAPPKPPPRPAPKPKVSGRRK